MRIAKARLRATTFEQPILSALQFVVHEHRDEIERWHAFRLGVLQLGVEYIGHAGEVERAQRTVEFEEMHVVAAQ